ncbi:MAG: single-stranded-DNA-specific exonuclease RecJ [Candidatus Gracilibacteria bacterium]|nr:single-stranded-DNA-specific exonuclease RecJ [Candidatus Gracilibacteria bacterium]
MQTIKGYKIKLNEENIDLDIIQILLKNRGIQENDLEKYFNPDFNDLFDPYLLEGMDLAVNRILEAKIKGERVMIFGDYDVDGVSSTAMLVRFFAEIGINVSYRLPHRANDGYGLKKHFIDEMAEKDVSLLITVDCGTRDIDVIEYAIDKKIDVLVTDHHFVPETVPNNLIALINPKLKNSRYPNSNLSGSGVAYKLLHAVSERIFNEKEKLKMLKKYIDFAMLGTISDCMPLIGENRVISFLGLKQIKDSCSCGLKKLIEGSDPEKMDGDVIGFKVGPRLNAAGRMDSPYKALRVLLVGEQNLTEALEEIENLNAKRKISTEKFIKIASDSADIEKNAIFFDSTEIEHGIIGLIAGRLSQAHNKVAIVLKDEGEKLVASCRSPEHINIISVLEEFKEMFIVFGGHDQAAGFSILKENFNVFKDRFEERIKNLSCDLDSTKYLDVDLSLSLQKIDFELIKNIEKMRPFGYSNPKPLFLIENLEFNSIEYLGKDQKHLKFLTDLKGIDIKAFGFGEYIDNLRNSEKISLIVELEKNVWNSRESISLNIKDIIL